MYAPIAKSGLACPTKLCCVHDLRGMRFLTATLVAAAITLAGCTSDGMPVSTGDSGSIGSFIDNLFSSKSDNQRPVPHNEVPATAHIQVPVEPPAPKTKSVTSKPKQPAVAVVPSPKQQASADPQSPPESVAPPALGGTAPILPTGSFDNRVGSRR